jgi:hypothetical protein
MAGSSTAVSLFQGPEAGVECGLRPVRLSALNVDSEHYGNQAGDLLRARVQGLHGVEIDIFPRHG